MPVTAKQTTMRAGWLLPLAAALLGAAQAATIHVTPAGADPVGASWATPTSLTNALAICTSTDQVWVAEGTYTNGATFTVGADCAVYGGFTNGMATFGERDWTNFPAILDGQAANRRVVTVTGGNVALDGLVVSNSTGNLAGGIRKDSGGGSLTLANCRIVDHAVRGSGAGGYFTSGTVLMTNCTVAGNAWPTVGFYYGGGGLRGLGIYVENASLDLVDSVVSDQSQAFDARDGLGMGLYANNGTCRVWRTEFARNVSSGGGTTVYLGNNAGTAAAFSNCVFRANQVANQAPRGAALRAALNAAVTARVVNCTFAYNTNAVGDGGAVGLDSGTLELRNAILWNNQATAVGKLGDEIHVAGGALRARASALTGTAAPHVYVTGGSATFANSMTNDPLFASAADFHVRSPAGRWESGAFVTTDTVYSPCVDAGDPADPVGAEPAENGARVNVGAYGGLAQASKSPSPPVAPQVTNRAPLTNDYTQMILRGELTNSAAVIATVGLCYGTNNVVADTTNGWQVVEVLYPPRQTGTVFAVTTPYLLTNTTYYFRWFATNAYGASWAAVSNFTTGPSYPPGWGVGGGTNVIHVRAGATGEGDGRDWFNAFTTIADGIAALAGSRTNIWITGGAYGEAAVLTLASSATLIGGFAGDETAVSERALTNALGVATNYTAIDGEGAHKCLAVTAADPVWLDTLSISNCPLPRALEKSGAGALTLNNCRIEKNALASGYTSGSGNGLGAHFSAGTVIMRDCVIADNEFPGPDLRYSNYGIGVYANGVALLDIADCVFSNQHCHVGAARTLRGAGLAFVNGTLRVARTQFVDNRGAANGGGGGALYLGNGAALAATFSNCLFRGNSVQPYSNPGYGGAVFAELNAAVTAAFVNCSFAANTNASSFGEGGAIRAGGGTVNLRNCILWTNLVTGAGSTGHDLFRASGTLSARHSSISALTSPTVGGLADFVNCRAGDPLFASPTDLHLQSPAGRWDPAAGAFATNDSVYSWCIDFGDPADPVGAEPAPAGGRVNAGCYGGTAEASKSPPPAPPLAADRAAAALYNRAEISGELTNAVLVAGYVYLCYGLTDGGVTTGGWDAVLGMGEKQNDGVFSVWTPPLAPATPYVYRWHATNVNGFTWTATNGFATGAAAPGGGAGVIHVDQAAAGAADGTDWPNAFTTIYDGFVAIDGSRTNVWITGGSYSEGVRLALSTDATVVGGFQGTETAVASRALTNAVGMVTNYTAIDGAGATVGLSVGGSGAVRIDTLAVTNALYSWSLGAALAKNGSGSLVANNCRIVGNRSGSYNTYGLGCGFTQGTVVMSNCVIADNQMVGNAWGNRGLGIYSVGADLTLVDCVLSNNFGDAFGSRSSRGLGLYFDNGTLEAAGTEFLDQYGGASHGDGGGGAVYLGPNANLAASFRNCVFRGNQTPDTGNGGAGRGAGMWLDLNGIAQTVTVVNCTFADNRNDSGSGATPGLGGAICLSKGTLEIRNAILWTNTVADGVSGREIYADSANSRVVSRYSCFTGTGAPYVVATNGAVAEFGDGMITNDPLYASATDVHLRSQGGRWVPAARAWTNDRVSSPCIDVGDPADAYGAELFPNGRRINIGAYGGTVQASRTLIGGTLLMVR